MRGDIMHEETRREKGKVKIGNKWERRVKSRRTFEPRFQEPSPLPTGWARARMPMTRSKPTKYILLADTAECALLCRWEALPEGEDEFPLVLTTNLLLKV
jgi:hypothetical protein